MLIKELVLDDAIELKDRSTGKNLATVKIASIVQYPSHIAIRLGFAAPQTTQITPLGNGKKELKFKNDNTNEKQS